MRTAVSVSSRSGTVLGEVVVEHMHRTEKWLYRFGVWVPPSEAALKKLLARWTATIRAANGKAVEGMRDRLLRT